jgi:hypothetical protein
VARNLLPANLDTKKQEKPLRADEARQVIEDYKEVPKNIRRWRRVRRIALMFGAAVWLGVDGSRGVIQHKWSALSYPVRFEVPG